MDMLLFKKAYIGFELLAGLTGLIYWKKLSGSYWQYFPIYLLSIACLETINYLIPIPLRGPLAIYFIIPFEFLFMYWLFYKTLPNQSKLITTGVLIYVFAFVLELVLDSHPIGKDVFLSFSYTIGNIILLVFILNYFYGLVNSDRILAFYHEQMFWAALGLLLFYLGTLPYFGMYNYMRYNYMSLLINYTWIVIFLNYIMYLLFTVSFIWRKTN
jgi:hypothetical protein